MVLVGAGFAMVQLVVLASYTFVDAARRYRIYVGSLDSFKIVYTMP